LTAVLAAIVGIALATVPVLIGATAYAVFTGIVAARLLSNELAQARRDHARDRAVVADEHRRSSVARSQENTAFATQLCSRIRLRDAQLAQLHDALLTAEIDLAKAGEWLSEERARSAALQADVDAAESDLESARADLRLAGDALAASESAELDARAQILAWEEALADESFSAQDRRLA